MAFWLIVAIVVSLSIGFVMGATFRQYKKPVIVNGLMYRNMRTARQVAQEIERAGRRAMGRS